MEYTGAVGTMVMDELAYVHEWTETGLGITGGKGVYNQWIHCDLIVIF